MPAYQEGQLIGRQILLPGLRLLPSDLLPPVTWPTRPLLTQTPFLGPITQRGKMVILERKVG